MGCLKGLHGDTDAVTRRTRGASLARCEESGRRSKMQRLGDRRDAGGRGSETGARVAVKAVGRGQRGGQGETWKGVLGSAPCDRIPLPGRLQGTHRPSHSVWDQELGWGLSQGGSVCETIHGLLVGFTEAEEGNGQIAVALFCYPWSQGRVRSCPGFLPLGLSALEEVC